MLTSKEKILWHIKLSKETRHAVVTTKPIKFQKWSDFFLSKSEVDFFGFDKSLSVNFWSKQFALAYWYKRYIINSIFYETSLSLAQSLFEFINFILHLLHYTLSKNSFQLSGTYHLTQIKCVEYVVAYV